MKILNYCKKHIKRNTVSYLIKGINYIVNAQTFAALKSKDVSEKLSRLVSK